MSRCRTLLSGLLATLLFASVCNANMFLNGEYDNGLKTHHRNTHFSVNAPAQTSSSNIFLNHAIISRQAAPFSGPTYLPPKEYLKCNQGQQCVRKNQCQNGYYAQQLPKIQNCDEETDVCCTYRPPPPPPPTTTQKPYTQCGRDSDCVSPGDCKNGEIVAIDYIKKQGSNRCYSPDICCRMPSTTLTDEGYIFNLPETQFPLPTNPTVREPQPTQPQYRPQPTQPEYRPQPTQPQYRPQPTQPEYRPQPTQPQYRPQPTQPAPPQTTYRPQPQPTQPAPAQTTYRPQPTQPEYRPQPTQPQYRPQPTTPARPTNEYLPPQTTPAPRQPQPTRPQPTQPQYRPQPTQPQYRPQPTQPEYRPQPTQPQYRPQPTTTPARPTNEYLPPQTTPAPRQPQPTRPQPTQPAYRPTQPPRQETPRPTYRPTQPPRQETPRPTYRPTPAPRQPPTYRPVPETTRRVPNEYLPPVSENEIPRPERPQRPERPVQPIRPQPPQRPQRPSYEPDRVPQPSNERPVFRGEDQLSPAIFPDRGEDIAAPRNYAKCASALECTDENYCNAIGVISETPVNLSPLEKAFRVPLTDCLIKDTGAAGKCCRDSNYVDPWPVNLAGVCAQRNKNTKPAGIKDIDANFAEIPWQVMILKDSTKSLLCGGAIIGDEFVLTTASCVDGVSVPDVRIKAGEWELGRTDEPLPFQLVSAKTIDTHPEYNPATGANDMAIIRLQKRLEFATHIQPICISDEDPSPNEQCITTGWGKQALSIHEEGAIMHVTSTSVQSRSDCGADSTGVCSSTKFDSCEFDSGSALACGTGGGVRLKGIYGVENACGEGQTVRFIKPDVKWINTAFAEKNKPLLLKRF